MDEAVLVAGYRLDRYELLCPIASGGMASVWLARLLGKRGFEKLVAIKTIRTELIRDPRYQEMFLDEARIASGIEHPNVAHIVDLGEQDDNLYIVMEWVDGESLAKILTLILKRGMTLPLPLALRVVADACAGLHAAHELRNVHGKSLGIVHRDVSPQNILITTAGTVKVIDFGIAKSRHRSASDTQAGTLKGKIRYMAPEQVNGQPIDCRADIWALAMCLGELISGREPFEELNDVEVMRHLMSPEPAPKFDALRLPKGIQMIFARSLVLDPNRRFDSATAMRRAIESAMEEVGRAATSEDVADFVRTNFADLSRQRREAISKAVNAADQRIAPTSSKPAVVAAAAPATIDAALAATAAVPASVAASVAPIEPVVAVLAKDEMALAPTQIGRVDRADPPRMTGTTAGGATLTEQLDRSKPSPRRGGIVIGGIGAFTVLAIIFFSLPGGRLRRLFASERPHQEQQAAAPTESTTLAPSAPPLTTPTPQALENPTPPTTTPSASTASVENPKAQPPTPPVLAPAVKEDAASSVSAEAFMKGTNDAQPRVDEPAPPSPPPPPPSKEEEKPQD